MVRVFLLSLLLVAVSAFAPQYTSTGLTRANTVTARPAYVPDGLSEAEYKKKMAEENSKKSSNKSRFPKYKGIDMGGWLKKMESEQVLKGNKYLKSGHTYAKVKFDSKEEYDKAKGRA